MARRDGATHVMPVRFTDGDKRIIKTVAASLNVSQAEAVRRMIRTIRIIYNDEKMADRIGDLPALFDKLKKGDDQLQQDLGEAPFD